MQNKNLLDWNAMKYIKDREALLRYADETPIMPKKMQDYMKSNYAQGACVQNYALTVTNQSAITLPDLNVGDIRTIQKTAVKHADNWLSNINPEVIWVYTDTKQYMNLITVFNEKDIDNLVNELASGSASGKEDFKETIDAFRDGADKNQEKITKLTNNLSQFRTDLESDEGNFNSVYNAAQTKYNADQGEMKQLKDKMNALTVDMKKCNAILAEKPTKVHVEHIYTGGVVLTISRLYNPDAGPAAKKWRADKKKYGEEANKYAGLQKTCALLQAVSNQFGPLSTMNHSAEEAVQSIFLAWGVIAKNLGGIKENMDYIIQHADYQFIVKKLLEKFINDAQSLLKLAADYEKKGILPVDTDDEIWRILHQGRCSIPALPAQPLPLDEYLALVRRRNLLGFN